MRTVYGALCTYRRSTDLVAMLDRLASQTRPLDHLVIIDNDDDAHIIDVVNAHPITNHLTVDVLGASGNPGPAGAFAIAQQQLADVAHADDLLITFDDDDPPTTDTLLEELCAFAERELDDKRVAGVGLRGGVLNERTGMIAPRPAHPNSVHGPDSEDADHLHGGWFPCYRFGALREVAGFDHDLFWGFEELDVGRRLKSSGYTLRVASDLYRAVAPTRQPKAIFAPLKAPSWRHFYRHRNLIRILRRDHAWAGLSLTIAVRLLLKPLVEARRSPRLAAWHLRTNVEAIRDGLRKQPTPKHRRHLPS